MAEKYVGEAALDELIKYIKPKVIRTAASAANIGENISTSSLSKTNLYKYLNTYPEVWISFNKDGLRAQIISYETDADDVTGFDMVYNGTVYHYDYVSTQNAFVATKYKITSSTMMTAADVTAKF